MGVDYCPAAVFQGRHVQIYRFGLEVAQQVRLTDERGQVASLEKESDGLVVILEQLVKRRQWLWVLERVPIESRPPSTAASAAEMALAWGHTRGQEALAPARTQRIGLCL